MSITTGTTDSVQISLGMFGEIKIDNNVYGGDINSSGEQIRAHKIFTFTISEVMEDAVSVLLSGLVTTYQHVLYLRHLGMDVKATETKLGNTLGQELHTLNRVTEYDTLINVELLEKSKETVDLLSLFYESVILCDTLEC